MAMTDPREERSGATEPVEVLACGRDLAALWDGAGEGARPETGRPGGSVDPHARDCPYCAAALADLARLRAAALAAVPVPGGEPDPALVTARVMEAVRSELRPGRTLPLGGAEGCWIHEAVAARSLRAAAEEVPGVRAGSCRVDPPAGRGGAAGRGPVGVRLEVTVEYGRDLPQVCGAVRRAVAGAADQRLGLSVAGLDVAVVDLHEPPGPTRRSPSGEGAE
ncbi:Asp23/Gls24 family envelope stress response protein [Streptomyces sp. NPDC097619]|uniref:Asp23/Gls24 family envelope stress response protein n=1 Tax=Streptomyces sp. NPDC097619 TaxID=3157228 RepID=UPI00332B7607